MINTEQNWLTFIKNESLIAILQQLPSKIGKVNIQRGDINTAINFLASKEESSKYLLVEITECDDPIAKLNKLAEICFQGTHIIILGSVDNIEFYHDIKKTGVDDYLALPVSKIQLLDTMTLCLSEKTEDKAHSVIAVTGSRGGVGASTVAINLSWLLAEKQQVKTALIDLDKYFGISTLALNLEANQGLVTALEDIENIDKVVLSQLMLKKTKNLWVLAATTSLDKPNIYNQDVLKALLDLVRKQFIISIIDLPHYTLPHVKSLASMVNDFVIVSDLSLIALRDTERKVQWLKKHCQNAVVHILVTQLKETNEHAVDKTQFEQQLGQPLDYVLPFDKLLVTSALNMGQPLAKQNNKITKVLSKLARTLYNIEPQKTSGLLEKIRNWF